MSLVHSDGQREVGALSCPLRMLQDGEQKRTVSSLVIVSDKYLEVKQREQVQGLLRVVLYLEDMGLATVEEQKGRNQAAGSAVGDARAPSSGGNSGQGNPVEEQIVW